MKNCFKVAEILEEELPTIIKKISEEHGIKPYIENPDFLEERLEKWHQFGLLTHTKKVRKAFLCDLEPLLKNWGIYEKIRIPLEEKIENIKKKDLFEMSIPLHDLGKIISYLDKRKNRNHEALSRDLIYEDFLKNKLKSFGLCRNHLNQIANYILFHDVIGKEIRDELNREGKLSLEYISRGYVNDLCEKVSARYANIKSELGIFFLCDSLGKTDIKINANTDKEIMRQELEIIETLKKEGLPSKLKYAVIQSPLTIKLAEIYLQNIFN